MVRAIIFLLLRRLKFSRFYKPWTFNTEMPLLMYQLTIEHRFKGADKSSTIFKHSL
jgi:hypothetical protein